jgi:hypothetical protein
MMMTGSIGLGASRGGILEPDILTYKWMQNKPHLLSAKKRWEDSKSWTGLFNS